MVVELTNPSDAPVSLDGLELAVAPNGVFEDADSQTLSGTLAGGASVVVRYGREHPIWAESVWFAVRDIEDGQRARFFPGSPTFQTRLKSGVRDVPLNTFDVGAHVYRVRFGAALGSHSFEADTTPPTWAPVPGLTGVTTTSTADAIPVTYALPAATDDSDPLDLVPQCTPAPGSLFRVNVASLVTCTVSDPYGNTSSIRFQVVVNRINGQSPGLTPAGQAIPIAGGGFIRNGRVRIVLRSEPVVLAETTADASGNVSLTVTLPADTTPGSHTIALEGEAPDGTPRLVVYTIEVSRPCTIVGTSRRDVIIGTKGDDVVCAGGGNDLVFALGGNDVVLGGAGNDVVHGGSGDDHLDGGAGFDIVNGGPGRDTLIGEVRRQ